ncbi:MAG: hypothetical protein R3E39_13420 [Anaerolineae bacterium]
MLLPAQKARGGAVPVLLLAQGDVQAKDLLRNCIQARYGLRPPAFESLAIQFKGRVRAKVGPVTMWVPVDASGRFNFPVAMRWDFIVKAVGVQIGSGSEAFDGETYRFTRSGKSPNLNNEPTVVHSLQSRLWAIAALLLTPLGDHFVKLETSGEAELIAVNTQIDSKVKLHLRPNSSVEYVEVHCLNPDTDKNAIFTLRLSEELLAMDDLIVPAKICAFWDNEPYFEIEPVTADANSEIDDAVFRLEAE